MTAAQGPDGGQDLLAADLGWMLGVAFRAYVKASEHVFSDLPGGPRGYQVLTAAVGERVMNQGSIAEELGMDRTVLTYLIDDLEASDLVARQADRADRRRRVVVATEKGRRVWEQHQEDLRRVEAHLLSPLAPSDRGPFRTLLRQVACGAQALDPLGDLCEVAVQVQSIDEDYAKVARQTSSTGVHTGGPSGEPLR
jgi:DNA-binding MarR family transcriptional regulator